MSRLIPIALVAFMPMISAAADLQLGDYVFVRPNAETTLNGVGAELKSIPVPAMITDMTNESLFLGKAWVSRHDVMTATEAKAFYNEQVDNEPENSMAFLSRGRARLATGHFFEAHKDFVQAIALDPKNGPAYRERAVCLVFQKLSFLAITDCDIAIQLDPTDPANYVIRGWLHETAGEYKGSIEDFSEAIRIDPKLGAAYAGRGYARCHVDQLDDGLKDLAEAIRVEPLNIIGYVCRAYIRHATNDFDGAIADLSEAIRLNPTEKNHYFYRGLAYEKKGEIDRAIDEYTYALQFEVVNGVIWCKLAWLKATWPEARIRDAQKAMEFANEAYEIFRHWSALEVLAAACAESGDFTNAVKWAEMSLEKAPDQAHEELQAQLESYRANKPFRDEAKEGGRRKYPKVQEFDKFFPVVRRHVLSMPKIQRPDSLTVSVNKLMHDDKTDACVEHCDSSEEACPPKVPKLVLSIED